MMEIEKAPNGRGVVAAGGGLYLGLGRYMIPIPPCLMRMGADASARKTDGMLARLSREHHMVRDFVVTEIPKKGRSLSADYIARRLDLPVGRVRDIIEELEKRMIFLFRNENGRVAWAYPVTAEATPHHVTFDTGERIHAAWAIDAIALPFVQGQLTKKPLSFVIRTECAASRRSIRIDIDSELRYRVADEHRGLRIFVPLIDVSKLEEPSIIDSFWRRSVFFRSEEDARKYRRAEKGVRGLYLTLDHSVYLTRVIQGAVFAFSKRERWMRVTARI